MLNNNFIEVPTYENGLWTVTEFQTREEFRDFLLSMSLMNHLIYLIQKLESFRNKNTIVMLL